MKVKLWQIKAWHVFKPCVKIWFSKNKSKSRIRKMPEQIWYGGEWFNAGYFILIQLKLFSVHIIIKWWEIK